LLQIFLVKEELSFEISRFGGQTYDEAKFLKVLHYLLCLA